MCVSLSISYCINKLNSLGNFKSEKSKVLSQKPKIIVSVIVTNRSGPNYSRIGPKKLLIIFKAKSDYQCLGHAVFLTKNIFQIFMSVSLCIFSDSITLTTNDSHRIPPWLSLYNSSETNKIASTR